MTNEPIHDNAALDALEAQLRGLTPAGGGLDRDAVLFDAGRAAERAVTRRWRGAAGMLALACVAALAWPRAMTPTPAPALTAEGAMMADNAPGAPTPGRGPDGANAHVQARHATPQFVVVEAAELRPGAYGALRVRVLDEGLAVLGAADQVAARGGAQEATLRLRPRPTPKPQVAPPAEPSLFNRLLLGDSL